ncbi:HesB/YadR/YfhF family protein [Marinicrinis lubricantis]|uniref:HesB/YadR/YfhF family protein n=1 Tax=Marinicrinis lubricantis TaxID=2086470 RepID=A0ABW1IR31_9BACL
MKIDVDSQAAQHFIQEMDLKPGSYVRFFTKYGGHSTIQTSYSLGISFDEPSRAAAKTEVAGITFYVEQTDLWYFDGHDLKVRFNEKSQEIEYEYPASE